MAVSYKTICDTRCQSFYTEMFKKENLLRIKWFLKNQEQLLKNLDKPTERRPMLPKKASSHHDEERAIWRKSMPQWRPPTSDGSINIRTMKPIDPKVLATLYEKQQPSFITAENYLHERMKEKPENRYYFPESVAWTYGWRLDDYPPIPPSKVKRNGIIRTEFFHAKGSSLNRNPDWYRECRRRNVKSCKK